MAKIKTLRDSGGGKVYPITSATAVIAPDGSKLSDYFDAELDKAAAINEGTPTSTDTNTRWGKFNAAEALRNQSVEAAESAAEDSAASAASTKNKVNEIKTAMDDLPDGQAVSAQVALNKAEISSLSLRLGTITGGTEQLTGDKLAGLLNTQGKLTTSQEGVYHMRYDLSSLQAQRISVTSTVADSSRKEYITLWALHVNKLEEDNTQTPVAKGALLSVKETDTIDMTNYQTAKYLYVGIYATTDTASASVVLEGIKDTVEQNKSDIATMGATLTSTRSKAESALEQVNSLGNEYDCSDEYKKKITATWNINGSLESSEYTTGYNTYVYKLEKGKRYVFKRNPNARTIIDSYSNVYVVGKVSGEDVTAGSSITKIIAANETTVTSMEYTPTETTYVATMDSANVPFYYVHSFSTAKEAMDEVKAAVSTIRGKVVIKTTDSETTILNKMIAADEAGDTDVIWEHGTYNFQSMYNYMRDTLGWTTQSGSRNKLGMPVGHNNRYYLNNSKLIATQPDGLEYKVDVFATRSINGNFEIYDGEIVNNNGQYCIHDEGGGYSTHYLHTYKNLVLRCVGATQCFGCGVGFNASINLEGCMMFSNKAGSIMSTHGVISNPDNSPIYTHMSIRDCYFEKYIRFNRTYFNKTRDNLLLYVVNCSMARDDEQDQRWQADPNFTVYEFNNVTRV